ncbi:MAG: hypothetical protein H6765_02400 [Candidatus Peribacteria bacterium]|nr:MAG: hypothetical protein H6765_02400 [Candidatus Peribacteria bacterium]
MKTITVGTYKDLVSKTAYLATGLVVILSLNLWFVFVIRQHPMSMLFLVVFVVFAWMFWRMWRLFTKLRYTFADKGITIHLPNGKDFFLSAEDIEHTQRIEKLTRSA